MSIREDIVANMALVLQNAEDPRFGLVTRNHFEVTKLSRQQFPAIYIQTADEQRQDESMTGSAMTRSSRLLVNLVGYVNGTDIDRTRNDLIERIEEVLEADRTRGGVARYTRIIEVNVDFDQPEHIGRVDIVVEVYYTYRRAIT
jgi:hypothetical protein